MIDFFSTLHIQVEKKVTSEEAVSEIVELLYEKGYVVVGSIGITEIRHNGELPSEECHNAYEEHYKKIKDAW